MQIFMYGYKLCWQFISMKIFLQYRRNLKMPSAGHILSPNLWKKHYSVCYYVFTVSQLIDPKLITRGSGHYANQWPWQ